ncbi:MAG: sugar ABC transporter substrate-binding protein [Lachnospiraceae bacterium]|nr:sugar ABC transporter substrate-binding protein [Lachnospiraceae bacterium]
MKKALVLSCVAAMAFSMTAFAGEIEVDTSKDYADINIGVSFGQNEHPYFVAMEKGILAALENYGLSESNYNLLVADSSLETQVSQIENLITMGCDAILLNPYDSAGVVNAVNEAVSADIPVITMDIDCEGSAAFIASDNYEIGSMLASYIGDALEGKGAIAIIDGISVTSLQDRTNGFNDTMAEKYPDIEIVAEEYTAQERDEALASAETILQAHPDIAAFVGVNENSGMAIKAAVAAAGLSDSILVTTVDATQENLLAIKNGEVAVGVAQNPYLMGWQAVELAMNAYAGQEIATDELYTTEIDYMNTDNVQEFIDREEGYGIEIE